jgi:hypothetical protein
MVVIPARTYAIMGGNQIKILVGLANSATCHAQLTLTNNSSFYIPKEMCQIKLIFI